MGRGGGGGGGGNYTESSQNEQFASQKQNLNRTDHDLNGQLTNTMKTSLKNSLSKIEAMQNAITKDKNDRATVD